MSASTKQGAARQAPARPGFFGSVTGLRVLGLIAIVVIWQGLAWSGFFYRNVIPPIETIIAALGAMIIQPAFWGHVGITSFEVIAALIIGGAIGVSLGVLAGGTRFAREAYEPAIHYLAPTPKIVFLPILIAFFGVGPSSKIAMGAISCLFPVALSVASGMAGVNPVHLRVAKSFGLTRWQILRKVELPSLVPPLITGLRLGLGVAVIGCVLSEIKLSNRGLGFLAIQYYGQFRIPEMYSVLIVLFALAGAANALAGRIRLPGRQTAQ